MPSDTVKYDLPYPVAADPVKDGENLIQQLAERVDLLLGETGTVTLTGMVADTTKSQRVNYARDYGTLIPAAFAFNDATAASSITIHIWTSAEDSTGFTLNVRSSSTSNRAIRWLCRAP